METFSVDFKETNVDGIRVFTLPVPNVGFVAMELVMFAGACDDEVFGVEGIHHWAEHIPFRGTKRFPGGYKDTGGHFEHVSGRVNAFTEHDKTVYTAKVPVECFVEALELLIDLAFHAKIRKKDVEAEREIIHSEMEHDRTRPNLLRGNLIQKTLYEGHPRANRILGTKQTLASADASTIQRMFEQDYSSNRMFLSISGNLEAINLFETVSSLRDRIRDGDDSQERTSAASYGKPKLGEPGKIYEFSVGTPGCEIEIVHPMNRALYKPQAMEVYGALLNVGVQAPLFREVREKRKLVYSIGGGSQVNKDAYFLNLSASMQEGREEHVLDAIWETISSLDDETLQERLMFYRSFFMSGHAMRAPNPSKVVGWVASSLSTHDEYQTESETDSEFLDLSLDDILKVHNDVQRDTSRTFIFRD